VSGLLLKAFHHLVDGFVSLLFETLVFALVFGDFLLGLLELVLGGLVLHSKFL
jgi:hypothetical protein